jgi:hypothetical protein
MTTDADPRVPAALRPTAVATDSGPDPLRYCVFATVALLAWIAGPVAVAVFAAAGAVAYVQAYRRGLRTSRCVLRFVPLVLVYLGAILTAAVIGVANLIR